LRLVWGGEARYDEVLAEGYLGRDDPIINRLYRAFAHSEWRIAPAWLLNAGAMVEHNDIVGTNFSPRVALNRRLAPRHAMRLSYTQAYRTPVILEEYADYSQRISSDRTVFNQLWKSRGGLDPERIDAYELGFMGYLGDSRSQYDVKLFREDIRNIVSHPTDLDFTKPFANLPQEALVFENIDSARLQGFELQLKLEADRDTMLSMGFSRVQSDGTVTTEINPIFARSISQYVPDYTLSFLLDHHFGAGWNGSMALYHTDHQKFWHDTSVTTMDLRIAKQFSYAGSEGVFAIAAHDINNRYFDYQDEYLIEPRVYASLEFGF
jgi:iron complex outermembrane receptor protein